MWKLHLANNFLAWERIRRFVSWTMGWNIHCHFRHYWMTAHFRTFQTSAGGATFHNSTLTAGDNRQFILFSHRRKTMTKAGRQQQRRNLEVTIKGRENRENCLNKFIVAKIRQMTTKDIQHLTQVQIIIFQFSNQRKFSISSCLIKSDLKYRTQTEVFQTFRAQLCVVFPECIIELLKRKNYCCCLLWSTRHWHQHVTASLLAPCKQPEPAKQQTGVTLTSRTFQLVTNSKNQHLRTGRS